MIWFYLKFVQVFEEMKSANQTTTNFKNQVSPEIKVKNFDMQDNFENGSQQENEMRETSYFKQQDEEEQTQKSLKTGP